MNDVTLSEPAYQPGNAHRVDRFPGRPGAAGCLVARKLDQQAAIDAEELDDPAQCAVEFGIEIERPLRAPRRSGKIARCRRVAAYRPSTRSR